MIGFNVSGETSDALNVQVDMFHMKPSMCFDICMGKPAKQGFQFQGIEAQSTPVPI